MGFCKHFLKNVEFSPEYHKFKIVKQQISFSAVNFSSSSKCFNKSLVPMTLLSRIFTTFSKLEKVSKL